MRDFNLRFYSKRWPDEILELKSNLDHYKKKPGCYVLGSSDGTNFIYPWGSSPIFYIGLSETLRGRLKSHGKWIRRATEEHHKFHFAPLHQYGASFGADAAIYKKRTNQSLSKLESSLITEFYNIYGSIPVANRAWPKLMKKPLGVDLV
ncbi:MAG: hypothetical protein JKY88_18710 [Pseudomonadales bacterium]|nr:hypothetical protein [Pseudomonadales bacterium]